MAIVLSVKCDLNGNRAAVMAGQGMGGPADKKHTGSEWAFKTIILTPARGGFCLAFFHSVEPTAFLVANTKIRAGLNYRPYKGK